MHARLVAIGASIDIMANAFIAIKYSGPSLPSDDI